jgi:DNA-binding XRE family transcriptional regulator
LHLALRIAAYFDVPVEIVFSLNAFERLGTNRETEHSEISPPRR